MCATSACRDEKSTPQHPVVSLQYCFRTNCIAKVIFAWIWSVNEVWAAFIPSTSRVGRLSASGTRWCDSGSLVWPTCVQYGVAALPRTVPLGLGGTEPCGYPSGFGTTFMLPLDCLIFLPCFFLFFRIYTRFFWITLSLIFPRGKTSERPCCSGFSLCRAYAFVVVPFEPVVHPPNWIDAVPLLITKWPFFPLFFFVIWLFV